MLRIVLIIVLASSLVLLGMSGPSQDTRDPTINQWNGAGWESLDEDPRTWTGVTVEEQTMGGGENYFVLLNIFENNVLRIPIHHYSLTNPWKSTLNTAVQNETGVEVDTESDEVTDVQPLNMPLEGAHTRVRAGRSKN